MVTTASILMQTQQSYDRRHNGLYADANTNSINRMIGVLTSV
jgi:hypothetical protein